MSVHSGRSFGRIADPVSVSDNTRRRSSPRSFFAAMIFCFIITFAVWLIAACVSPSALAASPTDIGASLGEQPEEREPPRLEVDPRRA